MGRPSHPRRLGLHPRAMFRRPRSASKGNMGPSDNHGHIEATPISASVSALVTQLHTELLTLATRNEELRGRIRNLRRVMRRLQEMAGTTEFECACGAPHPWPADHAIASPSAGHRESGSGRKSNRASVSLQRACRIALMETASAASVDEIYARIVRRGSFSFVSPKSASPALTRVLWVMARDGEVRAFKSGQCCRWQRTASTEISFPSAQGPTIGINPLFSGINPAILGL